MTEIDFVLYTDLQNASKKTDLRAYYHSNIKKTSRLQKSYSTDLQNASKKETWERIIIQI